METDSIVRPRAAAAFLGVSIATLYRWAREGQIAPPIKLGERTSGWRRSYLDAFIADREARGVPA
ncbi:helix-turn-helix transcriptional regulator [Paraburkholderia sp. EG286B]|uniref:helix-turn-helix transcriptional regulator n=1 Tax=Paraburkholderia sp. EG286B TaxID=3237011 RepID=UPI0034D2D78C